MLYFLGTSIDLDYVASILPLGLLLVAMPTVSEAWIGRLEFQRPVLVEPHELAHMMPDLALSESALRSGRWWTLVTHLCIHRDMDHLKSNLHCLLLNGYAVYRDWSALGLHGVFLLGGIIAGANRRGRAVQTESHLEARIPRAPEQVGPVQVPESARNFWDSVRTGFVRRAAPVVHTHTEAYGASSAISALMGYGFGASLSEMWRMAQDRDRSWETAWMDSPFLFASVCSLWKSFCFLQSEWQSMQGAEGYTGVDHSGHLTGFVSGSLLYVGRHAGPWLWRRWIRRPRGRRSYPLPSQRRTGTGRYISASGQIMD